MSIEQEVDKSVFEGAGFLLFRKSTQSDGHVTVDFILGERQKKPEDELKEPNEELEYQGGKPEGKENPQQTAENELNEEVGCSRDAGGNLISVLDKDWHSRAQTLWTFQPITKKWICCFLLQVNDAEYLRLVEQDFALSYWAKNEKRDFSALTGRPEASRKSLKGLYLARADSLVSHVVQFSKVPASSNRMKDAKAFGKTAPKFTSYRMTNALKTLINPLRAFNLVIFEQHAEQIARAAGGETFVAPPVSENLPK